MTGDEFLALAVELFAKNRAPNEAMCRTIISRAYYGAFHLAREYVVQLGFPETDKHRFLSDSLSASDEPNVMRAGDLLRSLATSRGRADYDLKQPHVGKQVMEPLFLRDSIERADKVRDLLRLATSAAAQATARNGIQQYWQRGGN